MTIEQSKRVTVGGSEYVLNRLDCFQALNVARLAAPALPVLFSGVIEGFLKVWREGKGGNSDEDFTRELSMMLAVAQPLFDRVAEMKKDDFDALMATCLGCVEKQRGKGFSPVIQGGVVMDDVPAGDALVLALQVIVREIRPIGAALFTTATARKA